MTASNPLRVHQHPVNVATYENATRGERMADRVGSFVGSWRFLAIQTVFVAMWIVGNLILELEQNILTALSEEPKY